MVKLKHLHPLSVTLFILIYHLYECYEEDVAMKGGYGYTWVTVKHGTLPEFLYQCHLEVGDQVTGHT